MKNAIEIHTEELVTAVNNQAQEDKLDVVFTAGDFLPEEVYRYCRLQGAKDNASRKDEMDNWLDRVKYDEQAERKQREDARLAEKNLTEFLLDLISSKRKR